MLPEDETTAYQYDASSEVSVVGTDPAGTGTLRFAGGNLGNVYTTGSGGLTWVPNTQPTVAPLTVGGTGTTGGWAYTSTPLQFTAPSTVLTFAHGKIRIKADGNVEIDPSLTLDEASKEFWNSLQVSRSDAEQREIQEMVVTLIMEALAKIVQEREASGDGPMTESELKVLPILVAMRVKADRALPKAAR